MTMMTTMDDDDEEDEEEDIKRGGKNEKQRRRRKGERHERERKEQGEENKRMRKNKVMERNNTFFIHFSFALYLSFLPTLSPLSPLSNPPSISSSFYLSLPSSLSPPFLILPLPLFPSRFPPPSMFQSHQIRHWRNNNYLITSLLLQNSGPWPWCATVWFSIWFHYMVVLCPSRIRSCPSMRIVAATPRAPRCGFGATRKWDNGLDCESRAVRHAPCDGLQKTTPER